MNNKKDYKDYGKKQNNYKKNNYKSNNFKSNNYKNDKPQNINHKNSNYKDSNDTRNTQNEMYDDITKHQMIEGRNPVLEALKSDRTIEKILVSSGQKEGSIHQIIAIAKQNGVIIHEVDRRKLDLLTETGSHQGVIAFVSEFKYVEVEDILAAANAKGEPPFIIILDEITDPHNLGSIIRTANSAGVHGVIIPKRRSVGVNAVVSKTSAGAIEYVPVAKVTNISQTIDYLKSKNVWVVGTDAKTDKILYETNLKGAIAIVIGSEGKGMSKLVSESCDFLVKIPMKGEISSLNASVAASLLMYEVVRQRD